MSDDETKNIWGPTRVGFNLSSNKFQDDEAYRSGGIAWVSQVRRSSHARTDGALNNQPHPQMRRASLGNVGAGGAPILGSMYKNIPSRPTNNFMGPSVSLMDQFSGLGDVTRAAELRNGICDLSLDSGRDEGRVYPPILKRTPPSNFASLNDRSPPKAVLAPIAQVQAPVLPPSLANPMAKPMGQPTNQPLPSQISHPPPMARPAPAAPQAPKSQSTSKKWKKKRFDSPLLDTLRSKSRTLGISDCLGHVVEVSTDQYGSRFIQEHLATTPPDVKNAFFDEACSQCLSLTTDVFGNYVIQQLFGLSTAHQCSQLVAQMKGHVLALSLQMYGCRVIQVAIKNSQEQEQVAIVEELRSHVLRCIKDHNGNHVVQKSIECISGEHVQFIYRDILANALELAKHTYGCRVVQRILEHGDAATKAALLEQLRPHVCKLTQDQYGNYIIQHIVDNGPSHERELVFDQLCPQAVLLGSHKYASNVVEKLFLKGTHEQRSKLLDQILLGDKSPAIIGMIKDQYANYVVQKILDSAREDEYNRLIASIRPHLATLKRNSYGKHLASVEKLLNVC